MVSRHGFSAQDQWQVQIQAEIQQHAHVYVYSHGLTGKQIRSALFNPCHDIKEILPALLKKYGQRLCVLPDGPLTIPQLA